MFYEAAGGRRYTGLGNAYQDFVDLSTLLKADRAILVTQEPSRQPDQSAGRRRCSATAGRWAAHKINT